MGISRNAKIADNSDKFSSCVTDDDSNKFSYVEEWSVGWFGSEGRADETHRE